MNRISNFFNAYRTEGIKLKNTNILTTALILSVFLPLILFITGIFSEDVYQTTAKEVNIVTENFSNLKKSFIQFFLLYHYDPFCQQNLSDRIQKQYLATD
ncbi:hypothetical protein QW060_23020 [Myroides ceti]|uniref:Uncharacterized protein n=1 Tax=Paenimyroides ceti TaxID=395087 RepID=A0ABT8CZ20_9FLAO|nr:hypothetical protein [Paenimyroides ceti]MDN3709813.1 hypothetical protein [Paenimyroides ceti]